jgi:two-component system, NtrC family, nitrogen regulation sensor histidine kinase GlnL
MSTMPPPPPELAGLDLLSTGAVVVDADSIIQYVNPAAETLLGISGILLAGGHVEQVFERSPELLAAIRTARLSQETVIEYELDVVVNGHPPIRLGCSISPLDAPQQGVMLELRAVDPQLRIARLEQARLQQEANRELLRNWHTRFATRSAASAAPRNCWKPNWIRPTCANTPRSSSRKPIACKACSTVC